MAGLEKKTKNKPMGTKPKVKFGKITRIEEKKPDATVKLRTPLEDQFREEQKPKSAIWNYPTGVLVRERKEF